MRLIDADVFVENIVSIADLRTISTKTIGEALDKTPTVDAVPVKHGRWINGKCDKCGGHAPFWAMASTYYHSKFCPNCGARMDRRDGEKNG